MTTPDHRSLPYEWRYLPGGRTVHAISTFDGQLNPDAECGTEPPSRDDWRGTGNQAEYDRAATLPPCHACMAAIRRTA